MLVMVLGFRLLSKQFRFYFNRTDVFIFAAAFLFVLINIMSSFGAINGKEAIFHTLREGALMLMFFLFYQFLRNTPKGKDVIVRAIVIMTFIFLVIGMVQLFNSDFTPFKTATKFYAYYFRQSISEVKSTLASINPFASFLVIALPFSIYSLITYNKYWKIFSGIVTLLSVIFIVLLSSKASMGSLGLAVILLVVCFYLYLFLIRPRETGKRIPLYLAIVSFVLPFVLVLAGIYFVQKTEVKVAKIIVEKVQQVLSPELCMENIYNSDNPTSTQTRTLVWANTIQMARDNPLLGVGPGQWRIEYSKYGLDGFEHDIRNGIKHFQRPHNDFLWILGETGFLGLVVYLFIYIGILAIAFRNFYRAKTNSERWLSALLFAFYFGFIINLFVSFPRERVTHNMVYLMAFALVLNESQSRKIKKIDKANGLSKLGILILFFGLSITNVWAAQQIYKGEMAARIVKIGIARKNYQLVLRASRSVKESLYTMDAFTVPMSYYEGIALSSLKNIDAARQAFSQAYALHPYHLQVLNNLGTSFDLTGNKEVAIKYYKEALAISPRYKEALINISIVYYNMKDYDKSMAYILQVPAKQNNPEKFRQTMLTICKRKAIDMAKACDQQKLREWYVDENKIEATFVTVQNTKQPFNKVLLEQVGK
jgi:O-antigen ligase/Flp pilus assembly protein TadD